jgi:hypothetical protein
MTVCIKVPISFAFLFFVWVRNLGLSYDATQYIDRLIDKQLIDEDAKEDIRIDEIMHFIDGPLYMEIAQADNVYTSSSISCLSINRSIY